MEEQAGHGQALLLAAAEGVVPVLDLVPALAPAAKAAASGAEPCDRRQVREELVRECCIAWVPAGLPFAQRV